MSQVFEGSTDVFVHKISSTEEKVVIDETSDIVFQQTAKLVHEAYKKAVAQKGNFTLVLAGGSLTKGLGVLTTFGEVDWGKFWIFTVDERNVKHDNPDSNISEIDKAFSKKVPIPRKQIFAITENLDVQSAATDYEKRLIDLAQDPSVLPKNSDGFPIFDLMLLGIGPDGHCASLFPNRDEWKENQKWVLPISNSPKPPPERITLTLPVINSAKVCCFVTCGEGKADALQQVLEVKQKPGAIPSQLVKPVNGEVIWLLDQPAAQKLHIDDWKNHKHFPQ